MILLADSTETALRRSHSLPVRYVTALAPWFPREIIHAGYRILQKKEVTFFTFLRRFGGLILQENIVVSLQMAKKRRKLPFVFRDGNCSKCGWQPGGGNCRHIAALALLCLQEQKGVLYTLADRFDDSPWQSIGKYIHEQTAMRRKIEVECVPHGKGWLLTGSSKNGLDLQIALTEQAVGEIIAVSPDICEPGTFPVNENGEDRLLLLETLFECSATTDEKKLSQVGMQSKKQRFESSLWCLLARLLFLHFPADTLQIDQDAEGIYVLQYTEKNDTAFSLRLPRDHTWELFNALSLPDVPVQTERAEQFSRVCLCPDGSGIEVCHCCRLANGKEYTLSEISRYSFGNRYQIDRALFTLNSVPAAEQLCQTQQKQLALFAPVESKAGNSSSGFTVTEKDVVDFVKKNAVALHCGRHQVAENIYNMKVVSVPDALVLEEYEEDIDWCYLAGWYGIGSHKIRLEELLAAAEAGKSMLPGESWLDLDNSPLAWFHQSGTERVVGDGGRIRMTRGEFLALTSQIETITCQKKEISGTLAAFLQQDGSSISLETKPAKHLRSYQRHGCNWLYQLQHYNLGGILADDMGLGKTHQALGLIDLLVDSEKRFLIVCPASVLYHWPEKQKSFFPQLSLAVYHGGSRNLETAMEQAIIVTSYGVLRQDIELFAEHTFALVIFDEMHMLKNRKTATYAAVSLLHADNIIGLSGTPVENNVQELETLLGICLPHIFTAQPIKQQFKYADSKEQRQHLQQLVAPFILRRTRAQVLVELPECSEDIRICELSSDQIEAYREAAERARMVVDEYLDAEEAGSFTTILVTITRLKQICNHLCQLEQSIDYSLYKSGKWDEFIRLVGQCLESGLKMVVFSQFTAMLDIIEQWLADTKTGFVAIRGDVPARERSRRIARFNDDKNCKVCCASLLAGGVGIDLTGAQVVIHYDRWWNPAKEEQATARVYRMGQKHPVQVYKLVTAGTLEEKIHRLIEDKRALAADLLVEDDGSILKILKREDLVSLFQFGG